MNTSSNTSISMSGSEIVSIGRDTALMVVEMCISVILNIAVLAGNSLVCLAFYRNPSIRTVTNYFVFSLAITDLSMATLVMPFYTPSTIIGNGRVGGTLGCQIGFLISNISAGTSLITVMLLAINRVVCVVRPEKYTNMFSKKRSIAIAASAWIVTLVTVTIESFLFGLQFQNNSTVVPALCIPVISSPSVSVVITVTQNAYIAVPSLVVAVCYVKIYRTIRQHNTAAAPPPQGAHSAYGVEEAKITRLLTIIVVGFYICWMPVFVTNFMDFFDAIGIGGIKFYNFYITLPLFASSAVNPIIYATLSNSFRNEFRKILRCEHKLYVYVHRRHFQLAPYLYLVNIFKTI